MMSEQISSIRDNLITMLVYNQKECSVKIWINVHSHVSDQIVNSLETSDHNNLYQGFYCYSKRMLAKSIKSESYQFFSNLYEDQNQKHDYKYISFTSIS